MSGLKSLAPAAALLMAASTSAMAADKQDFDYTVDRFADIEVLRYRVPDFETLSLDQKRLVYYLTEAALWGRDILWDQNCRYNLSTRRLLEDVYTHYDGDRNAPEFKAFETYLKQVWFANGLHHHYSMDKFRPGFSQQWLESRVAALPLNLRDGLDLDIVYKYIFDPTYMAKRVNQAAGQDLIHTSANNMYSGVTQPEVEAYYAALKDTTDLTPISYGLNTRVVKDSDGTIREEIYKLGGLYSDAIAHIVDNLTKAMAYAENDAQRMVIARLIDFYTTGDLKTF